jgi:hypothetical protein
MKKKKCNYNNCHPGHPLNNLLEIKAAAKQPNPIIGKIKKTNGSKPHIAA